jgi:predicted deacetylase
MTKKAVISFHDASIVFQKEIENVMHSIPQKKSFLITPLWHGKGHLDEQFARLMRSEDNLLHGLTHRSDYFDPYSILLMNKNISREFLHLDYASTETKIALGVKLFQDKMDDSPRGFIPPMWYHNKHTMTVLKEMAFCYTETWTTFVDLKNDNILSSYPLSLDYGSNSMLSDIYYKGWKTYFKLKKPPLIRVAIHPSDMRNGMIAKMQEMLTRLEDENYTFLTYSELLSQTSL